MAMGRTTGTQSPDKRDNKGKTGSGGAKSTSPKSGRPKEGSASSPKSEESSRS